MTDSTHPSDELLAAALDTFEREQAAADVDVPTFVARYPAIAERLTAAIQMHRQLERLEARPARGAKLPERLGRYVLGAELGRGGMAPVFLARDEGLSREVALKVLLPDALRPDRRVRFLREARALARIGHPNVVSIFDVGEDGEIAWFAMERLASSLVGRAGSPEALRWGLEAALGLAAAHAAGVLHRDVKPGNLLLGADGVVRVGDFGLAQLEGDASLTATGQVMGTLRYAAPEQLLGELVTAASDVYSLGATLRELAAPAASGSTADTRTSGPLAGAPGLRSLAGLPRATVAVLSKATASDPASRYVSMQAFADDLRALVEGRSPSALGRTRAPALSLGVVLTLAAVGAAWWGQRPNPSVLEQAGLLWSGPAADVSGPSALEQTLRAAGREYQVKLADGLWLEVARPQWKVRLPLAPLGLDASGGWRLLPCVDRDRDGVDDVVLSNGTRAAVVKLYAGAFGDPALGWVERIGGHFNYGSPTVIGRDIWLGEDGSDPTTGLHSGDAWLYAIELERGQVREQHRVPGAILSTVQEHAGALFIDADRSATGPGGLFRLRPGGEPEPLGPSDSGGGLTWPVFFDVDQDGVDEAIVGSLAGRLSALDATHAAPTKWSVQLDGQLSYPVLVRSAVCVSSAGHFQCVDARTGALQWQVEIKAGCVARPLAVDGALLCGSGRGDSAVYVFERQSVERVPLPDAARCSDPGQPCFAARLVALDDGRIVGATTSGFLFGWSRESGGLRELFSVAVGAPVVGTPVPFRDGVLVTSYDGWLRWYRLSGPAPELAFAYRAVGPIGGAPAIVDGKWAVFAEVGPRVYKVPLPAP